MTFLALLTKMQAELKANNFNPDLAYTLILHNNNDLKTKDDLIDARNEEARNVPATLHDLDLIINHNYPISQITGECSFYGLNFQVDDGVFAPRNETELLVEQVYNWIQWRDKNGLKVVDLCCGTGVIGITLVRLCGINTIQCICVDQNPKAIKNAAKNQERLKTNVQFIKANLISYLEEQAEKSIDVIVSNPPYISYNDPNVESNAQNFDPWDALYAGDNGLFFYEKICQLAQKVLQPDGLIAFEIGFQQGQALEQIAKKYFPNCQTKLIKDYSQRDRIFLIKGNNNV